MKMKEFGPPGGASLAPPLDPPLDCHMLELSCDENNNVVMWRHFRHFLFHLRINRVTKLFSDRPKISQTGKGRQPLDLDQNLLFGNIFDENYVKMKEIGPRREGVRLLSAPFWIRQLYTLNKYLNFLAYF